MFRSNRLVVLKALKFVRVMISGWLAAWPRSLCSGTRHCRVGCACACMHCRARPVVAASGLVRSRLPLAPPCGADAAAADCPARAAMEPLPAPSARRRICTTDLPLVTMLPLPTPLQRCAAAAYLFLVRTWAAPRRRLALMALRPCMPSPHLPLRVHVVWLQCHVAGTQTPP